MYTFAYDFLAYRAFLRAQLNLRDYQAWLKLDLARKAGRAIVEFNEFEWADMPF